MVHCKLTGNTDADQARSQGHAIALQSARGARHRTQSSLAGHSSRSARGRLRPERRRQQPWQPRLCRPRLPGAATRLARGAPARGHGDRGGSSGARQRGTGSPARGSAGRGAARRRRATRSWPRPGPPASACEEGNAPQPRAAARQGRACAPSPPRRPGRLRSALASRRGRGARALRRAPGRRALARRRGRAAARGGFPGACRASAAGRRSPPRAAAR
mmetsp:Transcript_65106/g.209865  ORF Transcript_65106/g.209865 Transcript_65106/m.209865 type:complete len:218 (+) Transcript_65106:224-877(+)